MYVVRGHNTTLATMPIWH